MRYHPLALGNLTSSLYQAEGTMAAGQFDWGGLLLKSNGGTRWYPQYGWKSYDACKGIRVLDCETDMSSRYESRS